MKFPFVRTPAPKTRTEKISELRRTPRKMCRFAESRMTIEVRKGIYNTDDGERKDPETGVLNEAKEN